MFIARVSHTVVATIKDPVYRGNKLFMVQPLDLEDNDTGNPVLAIDTVDSGIGDKVLVTVEGGSAQAVLGIEKGPVDAVIVGFVDYVDLPKNKAGG